MSPIQLTWASHNHAVGLLLQCSHALNPQSCNVVPMLSPIDVSWTPQKYKGLHTWSYLQDWILIFYSSGSSIHQLFSV